MADNLADSTTFRPQSAFQELLNKLPTAAYMCDADGLITYFNPKSVELWGQSPRLNDPIDRFCGSFRLFAADGSPIRHEECWMALALRTGNEFNRQEIIIERPDGSSVYALAHANPIRDENGNLVGAVNILVDVTNQRQAERALNLLASIVESSDDAIVSKTLEGRILSWNAGAERLFEYSADEAVGSSIELIIPPDRYDEEKMILSRLRRGERIEHYETVRISKSGRLIDISLTISPIRDAMGRIIGASKIARDITARKQGDADLQQLHEMSLLLASSLELPIIVEGTLRTAVEIAKADKGLLLLWDTDTNSFQVGASLNHTPDFLQWIEKAPLNVTASGMCFQGRQRIFIQDVEAEDVTTPFRDAARSAGFSAVHSTPLITRKNCIVGVLSLHFRRPNSPSDRIQRLIDLCARQAVDFIETARLYEREREANRHKDEFLATLAHELRSPLAPLSNALSLLSLQCDLSPAVDEMRSVMERQVSHMVRLVNDLLDVSRIDRGKVELRKETVDLSTIIAGAVETVRPVVDAAHHKLNVALSCGNLAVVVDAVRVTQVLTNLLNNAAKYMDPGGQIWLNAEREIDEVVISVRDTGFGIAAESLPFVFDKFTQVGRKISGAQGGLGIGLSLAKHLVELHGGLIEARSDGPGNGSEFVVRIPLTASAENVRIASFRSPPSQRTTLPAHRILLVDDTQAAAYVLQKLLETLGQSVHTEHSGASALQYAKGEQLDVVISDISMPVMDGYELARSLRELPDFDDVILVALTGYGQEKDRRRTAEAGYDYHLVKPVSVEMLRDVLSQVRSRCPDPTESTG